MSQNLIVLPVFAQVLLTFAVMVIMGARRQRALKGGTKLKDIALGQSAWPDDATKAANNFKNQFETPVLFYAACAFALMTKSIDFLFLALAWGFVTTRLAHVVIHVGANEVRARAAVYVVGVALLLVMWVLVLIRGGLGL